MNMEHDLFKRTIGFVGVAFLVCLLGIISITVFTDKPLPDILKEVTIGIMGLFGGLLVQKQPDPSNPMPVQIAPASEPVVVTVEDAPVPPKATRRRTAKGHADAMTILLVLLIVLVVIMALSYLVPNR